MTLEDIFGDVTEKFDKILGRPKCQKFKYKLLLLYIVILSIQNDGFIDESRDNFAYTDQPIYKQSSGRNKEVS